MIYLFSGDDVKRRLKSYEEFVKNIPQDVEIFKFNRNDFSENQLESFYSGPGLFFKKALVVFSNVLEYEETRDFVLSKLPFLGDSINSFVFLEGKLSKIILDDFKKARAELNIFELPKVKTERFDNFLVANAFGNRDKLNLWIYFRQAVDAGVVMEELIGVLFWKIKDMLLKKNFSRFSEQELQVFIRKLSFVLPEARSEGKDAEASFEKFLLEAF